MDEGSLIYAQLAVLLVLALCAAPASSFAPSPSETLLSRRHRHGSYTPRPSYSAAYANALTSSTAISQLTTEETSNELLSLLQQKAAPNNSGANNEQINSLVRKLISSKSSFDPTTCIDGPLFASVHFIGDTPLWEKIGAPGGIRNVKGQKYTLNGGTSGTFVNYAEIFGGNAIFIKAVGDCKDEGPVVPSSPMNDSGNEEKSNNPFEAIASLFNSGKAQRQANLLPTPYDYSATVTGASIVLLQKYSLDLTIAGTGTVRVLYADDKLRIFLSPTDTNVTKGAEGWESSGLIVVQVRVDLVYDDWVDRL